ncbi:MAG: response regulator [Deltaproteobacteria bacterium]|jgi:DNA-binding NarL/FixJ family response regulator|nr:response regulator [Deltaproteobacteria bacterium]
MTPNILFYVKDKTLDGKLKSFLVDGKYRVLDNPDWGPPGSSTALAADITALKPDLVIMDYVSEDAFSVKVLQEAVDVLPALDFVFVDGSPQTTVENVVMAFNEGARGFLSSDVTKQLLLTTLARVFSGPARFRPISEDASILESENQKLGQKLSKLKVHLNSAQKLVNYLLTTPLGSQPRKVLVLSDSGYQRELIKKILEDSNFMVITSATMEDAISQVLSEKPRIIISDYNLEEGKTGVDFCKEVKFTHKFVPCYFVVCTAGEEMIPKIMAPGNGVDDSLLKPGNETLISEFITRIALGLIL